MILIETIAAFMGTFGFGIVFNIKGKNLFFASLGGGLSWLIYKIVLTRNVSDIGALFISSIIFSIYSEICARVLKTPVTTLVICALIPLVPGGGMYYTMYAAVQGNALKTWTMALNTLSAAGALALGILFVSTITRFVNSARRNYYSKDFKIKRLK